MIIHTTDLFEDTFDIERKLKIELSKILYSNFYLNFYVLLLTSSVIYWLIPEYLNLKYYHPYYIDEFWYSAFLIILFLRYGLYKWYKHTHHNQALANKHYFLFITGSTLTAIMWGLLSIFISPLTIQLQIFFIFLVFSLIGGAVITLSASFFGTLLYISVGLFPFIIVLIYKLTLNIEIALYASTLTTSVVYYCYMIIESYRLNKTILKNFKTTLKKVELNIQLSNAKAQLEKIINTGLEGVWYVDENLQFLYINDRLLKMLGYTEQEVIGKSVFSFLDNENKSIVMEHVVSRYKTKNLEPTEYELEIIKKDQSLLPVKLSSASEYDEATQKFKFLGMIIDLKKEKEAEKEIAKSEKKYRELVELSPAGILILDQDKIVFANTAMTHIMEAKNANELYVKSIYDILDPKFHEIKRDRLENIYKNKTQNDFLEEEIITLEGNSKQIQVLSKYFEYEKKPCVLILANDISEQKKAQRTIEFLAIHDPLTSLYNRNGLENQLKMSFPFALRDKLAGLVLLYIFLDEFNVINDTLGLRIGDLLIQNVAKQLKEFIREIDIVARLEKDEFSILLRQVSISPQEISKIVDKLVNLFRKPLLVDGRSLITTVSVGIAIFPKDGEDELRLINHAHLAMESAKAKGGNSFQFYVPALKGKILEEVSLKDRFTNAFHNNELYLEYQPKISLKTGKIVGLEALLRWKDPVEGQISPSKFIPLAEDHGLIIPLTRYIIDQVCNQLFQWKKESVPLFRTSLNLSPHNFNDKELPNYFLLKINEYKLVPSLLEVEITETAFLQNIEQNIYLLKQFKNYGIQISMDDFGTGYSSLSYIQYMAIDNLKIDKAFIKDLPKEASSIVLVSTIIEMAHNLKINVIAEGVETKSQVELLKEKGCDEIQGFYASLPLKGDKVPNFIKNFKGL